VKKKRNHDLYIGQTMDGPDLINEARMRPEERAVRGRKKRPERSPQQLAGKTQKERGLLENQELGDSLKDCEINTTIKPPKKGGEGEYKEESRQRTSIKVPCS